MKKLLTGNEAIARGAYEAGCTVAAAIRELPVRKFWRISLIIKKYIQNGHLMKR